MEKAPENSVSQPSTGKRDQRSGGLKPYQKPRIEKRVAIVANTLISGQECVFDPPPC